MRTMEGLRTVSTHSCKDTLRGELLTVRGKLTADDIRRRGDQLAARAGALPELTEAETVAAYVSFGGEPDTRALIEALHDRGVRVLLPVLLPDNDLDWAAYEGRERLRPGRLGLREPAGPRLGASAVTGADAVLLPGLAVDHRGFRLGRGGGSYDRVLARLDSAGSGAALVVLLYDDEVRDVLPREPHDRPVRAAVTPSKLLRF